MRRETNLQISRMKLNYTADPSDFKRTIEEY
jgi:hypothetical protein